MIVANEQELGEFIRQIFREELAIALQQKKERLFTVEEAAKELRMGRSTLDKLTRTGKVKCTRVTGRPMYLEAEIEKIKSFGVRHL
jgi:excisionase family DNA binding protein